MKTVYSKFIDFLATGFFSGKCPKAPGTAGSLIAGLLLYALYSLAPSWLEPVVSIPTNIIFVIVAILVSEKALTLNLYGENVKDPKQIVIDEFAGMLVAVAGLPFSIETFVLAFVFFRLFDITKPPPVRQLEILPGGIGIVLDDIMAGILANIVIRLIYVLF